MARQKSLDIQNLSRSVLSWFKTTGNGLISPDGELYPVRMFDHFAELKRRPEFEQMILDFEDERNEAQRDFEESIPEGEHPGWHTFEIWEAGREDELRTEVLDKAYQLGWGRIAFMQKRPKPHLVELETHPGTVQILKPYAQNVAELCDAELQVHKVEKSFSDS